MGSRFMHYCISVLIARQLPIHDLSRFIVGGLAPDAASNKPKSISHFMERDADGLSTIHPDRFLEKYHGKIHDPFFLGYYCHLISDQVWLDHIYVPKIKWLPPEEKLLAQKQNYRDFGRINGRLMSRFSIQIDQSLLKEPVVEIDEIEVQNISMLLQDVQKDAHTGLIDAPLELLNSDDIYAFITESTELSIQAITNLSLKR